MVDYVLTNGQDVLTGTSGDDRFFANDASFNPGDVLDGAGGFDVFKLFLADFTALGASFAGFEMENIERFEVTNDKPGGAVASTVTFDMSGVFGLQELASINSSSPITWTQLTSLVSIDLINTTDVGDTDVQVFFQNAVVAGGNDTVDVNVDGTDVDLVRIGSIADNDGGIENVNLTAIGGMTSIETLDTDLTTLNIFGAGDIEIVDPLNTTVRFIDATGQAGDLTISFLNNGVGQGVVFDGSQGNNDMQAGAGSDTITTFDGDDIIRGGQGNNVIDAGDGMNVITAGVGNDNVTAGSGADNVQIDGGNNFVDVNDGENTVITGGGNDTILGGDDIDRFNSGAGNDSLSGFGGNDIFTNTTGEDTLIGGAGDDIFQFTTGSFGLDAGNNGPSDPRDFIDGQSGLDTIRTDALNGIPTDDNARLENVFRVERIVFTSAGDNYLGGFNAAPGQDNAQAAGIRIIRIGGAEMGPLAYNGNDRIDASTMTNNLRVESFGMGDDTILTGSGIDLINMFDNLDDNDVIDGGASNVDKLLVNDSTTLTGANQITNVEQWILDTSNDALNPNTYNITLNNAQLTGGELLIRATRLQDYPSPFGEETLTLDGSGVSAFSLDVRSGAGDDVITSGQLSDEIRSGGGDDIINGNAADLGDLIVAGDGNDTVNLFSGNNDVRGLQGDDVVLLGTGDDSVFGQLGNDLIISGNDANPGDRIDGNDLLVGGSGNDTLQVNGDTLVDANFGGLRTTETLLVEGTGNLQIGANAQAGGIARVLLSNVGDNNVDASAFTAPLFVDMDWDTEGAPSGNDTVLTGSGDDLVDASIGTTNVSLGGGNDTYTVREDEFDFADTLMGGTGLDTVTLDNSGTSTTMTARVDLDNVRSIERYVTGGSGNNFPVNVADTVELFFRGSDALGVGSVTPIAINNLAMTDSLDTLVVRLGTNLTDDDYSFTITGSNSATTRLIKRNDDIDNNINFQGGNGVDELQIAGTDLGSTVIFNGGGGSMDKIIQENGPITDDGYVGVTFVEILTADFVGGGFTVDATLGSQAAMSGLVLVQGTDGNDMVLLDGGYNAPTLTFDVDGGDDTFTGGASSTAITFVGQNNEFTAADLLQGGSSVNDLLRLDIVNVAFGADIFADLTGVTGVETILINNTTNVASSFPDVFLTLDTLASETATGQVVVNIDPLDDVDINIDGGAMTADLIVNHDDGDGDVAEDTILSGSGNDVLNIGGDAGSDDVATGAGNDTVNVGVGGQVNASTGVGNDVVNALNSNATNNVNLHDGNDEFTGGSGSDFVEGDAGNDLLRGGLGNDVLSGGGENTVAGNDADTILGGAGNDNIHGGLDGDVLTGGADADIFYYERLEDSSFPTGEDTITDFQSGVDRLDFRAVADLGAGVTIDFEGNAANFADAQSLVTVGSGELQIVYQQDTNTLWVDLNDDGTLDGDDIRIEMDGVASMIGADVFEGSVTTATGAGSFEANFGLDTAFFNGDGTAIIIP